MATARRGSRSWPGWASDGTQGSIANRIWPKPALLATVGVAAAAAAPPALAKSARREGERGGWRGRDSRID
eukprot:8120275-Pyramimonas_sp.AAC.1